MRHNVKTGMLPTCAILLSGFLCQACLAKLAWLWLVLHAIVTFPWPMDISLPQPCVRFPKLHKPVENHMPHAMWHWPWTLHVSLKWCVVVWNIAGIMILPLAASGLSCHPSANLADANACPNCSSNSIAKFLLLHILGANNVLCPNWSFTSCRMQKSNNLVNHTMNHLWQFVWQAETSSQPSCSWQICSKCNADDLMTYLFPVLASLSEAFANLKGFVAWWYMHDWC